MLLTPKPPAAVGVQKHSHVFWINNHVIAVIGLRPDRACVDGLLIERSIQCSLNLYRFGMLHRFFDGVVCAAVRRNEAGEAFNVSCCHR